MAEPVDPLDSAARVHGGIDPAELASAGVDAADVVDFSVNINPYGPPESLLHAVREARFDRYPDPHARAAREAWSRVLEREVSSLSVGNGAADLFWAIARGLLRTGDRVLIAEPTFSEFRVAAAACGAQIERVFAPGERAYAIDLSELARRGKGARALYLCSPNNPTGELIEAARVRALAQELPETTIVLDQSFLALSDRAHELYERLPDNVLAVRSLTKEYSCPGLRIGLCVGDPARIASIEGARPTWATSSVALAALEACARERAFVRASWERLRADRDEVRALLQARGYRTLSTSTTYQLVELARPASALRAALLAQGVLARDCASFGLPRHLRVAALPAAARSRLARALDAVAAA